MSGQALEAFAQSRCLVSGGAGFIGSNLVRRLVGLGARVTVLDNLSVGKTEHLAGLELRLVEADIRTFPHLGRLAAEADFVFHLAAQVGNVKSIERPEADAETNVIGTVRLLESCRTAPVRRVVYSSSSAIFGEAEVLPVGEDHPQRPASFYALSKLTAERYALLAHELWGLPTVCLRYFNVFGLPMEENEYTGVISIFLRRVRAGQALTVYGDGGQVRDFVYVEDVVQANLLAALRGRPGGTYNIGSGQATSVVDLARVLGDIAGRQPEIAFAPERAGEVRRSVAAINRAREELGFDPEWDVRRGLAVLWERLRDEASGG